MRSALLGLAGAAGCYSLPPPPVLPTHALSAPDPLDTTTAMVVVGGATDLGGFGLGLGVRVERQETDATTLGLEVSGGKMSRGDPGGKGGSFSERWHSLVAVRGYGRYSTGAHTALLYGAGLSALGTRVVTATVHGGAQATGDNAYFDGLGAIQVAFAVPLYSRQFIPDDDFEGYRFARVYPTPALYVRIEEGAIVPIDDTGNRLSLDFGVTSALPLGGDADGDWFMDASVADIQRSTLPLASR